MMADMTEPTLPTLPAEENTCASVDLGYRTQLPDHDDATDVDPPLAIYEEEDEVDSVIVPNRHEEATPGEERLRAWRELSEERAIARQEQDLLLAEQRLQTRRRAGVGAGVAALLGVVLVATSQLSPADTPAAADDDAPPPAIDLDGPVFAAPAVAIVIPPAAEPEPVAAEPEPVAAEPEPAPVAATPSSFDPQVVNGTLNTWTADATAWLQFDFLGTGPLEIRWLDAQGEPALNPWTCDGYVNRTTRRCYVGRTHERIAVALRAGAAPGTWAIQACAPGTESCTGITTIQVADSPGG